MARVDPEGSSPANAGLSRRNLLFGESQRTQTMMQLCASAAKLRGGGPILIFGVNAMGMCRVTTTSDRHRQFVASEADECRNSLSLLNRYWSTESCRWVQHNALRDDAILEDRIPFDEIILRAIGIDKTPQDARLLCERI